MVDLQFFCSEIFEILQSRRHWLLIDDHISSTELSDVWWP